MWKKQFLTSKLLFCWFNWFQMRLNFHIMWLSINIKYINIAPACGSVTDDASRISCRMCQYKFNRLTNKINCKAAWKWQNLQLLSLKSVSIHPSASVLKEILLCFGLKAVRIKMISAHIYKEFWSCCQGISIKLIYWVLTSSHPNVDWWMCVLVLGANNRELVCCSYC